MNDAYFVAATGMIAQQRALDLVANNVANINSPAFKRSSPRFAELFAPVRLASEAGPTAAVGGMGVTLDAASRVWNPGEIRETGNALDLAIDGPGFIEVLGPAGQPLLWRGGTLRIDSDGQLATRDGFALRAAVSVPRDMTAIRIDASGAVLAEVIGEVAPQEIGRIELAGVEDQEQIRSFGGGYYLVDDPALLTAGRPGDGGQGRLMQGAVEQSNVSLSEEMIALLLLQRAYGANARVVQAGDELMALANALRR